MAEDSRQLLHTATESKTCDTNTCDASTHDIHVRWCKSGVHIIPHLTGTYVRGTGGCIIDGLVET